MLGKGGWCYLNKHPPHNLLHSAVNQLSAGFLLMGSIWCKGIFRRVSLITKFLLNLPPCLAQHVEGTLSSQQPKVPALCTQACLKHHHPSPVCFRRNRICSGAPGCAQCHPGCWQHPAAADSSEMSLRIGLQMIKYTIALALAKKIFAVAGRKTQCSSNRRCPALFPLNPKPFLTVPSSRFSEWPPTFKAPLKGVRPLIFHIWVNERRQ